MTTHYQPSGLVDPLRLAISIAVLIPLAALLGFGLCVASLERWYFIIFAPAVAVVPLAAAGRVLARWSQMRNPNVGLGVGAALGVLLYVAQFHALLITKGGLEVIARLDLLPGFLVETVNNLVIGRSFGGGGEPAPWLNWIVFSLELALCASASASQWYLVGRSPYCERCGRWLFMVTTRVSGGSARLLAEALAGGSLESLPMIESRFDLSQRYGELQVSGCQHGGDGHDATIYVSIFESMQDGERMKTQKLADLVAISPGDLVTLYERCPGLLVEPIQVDVAEPA